MRRIRALQHEATPPVVQVRIVRSQEIARCPSRSWAPSHWLPEHAIEECDTDARARMRAFDAAWITKRAKLIALIDKRRDLERERLIRVLRDAHTDAHTDAEAAIEREISRAESATEAGQARWSETGSTRNPRR